MVIYESTTSDLPSHLKPEFQSGMLIILSDTQTRHYFIFIVTIFLCLFSFKAYLWDKQANWQSKVAH